ncbi:MAG: hypothetical protein AB8B50_13285 [Pirellulaceae bacterium]
MGLSEIDVTAGDDEVDDAPIMFAARYSIAPASQVHPQRCQANRRSDLATRLCRCLLDATIHIIAPRFLHVTFCDVLRFQGMSLAHR